MSTINAAVLIGFLLGWVMRGWLTGFILRHAVARDTRDRMNADIDRAMARLFRRKHKAG